MRNKKAKLSPISSFHYIRLFCRSLLFLCAAAMYILNRVRKTEGFLPNFKNAVWILAVIWVAYAVEMALRFFPAKLESMGCQKQFARNFKPTETGEKPKLTSPGRVWAVVAAWAALNSCIGALYFAKVIDRDVLVLVSLAYGVCDMICILFFCPFQEWFLKNRCCTVCRIYNWDFAMMFTPYIFIPSVYTWTLLAMSLAILIRWELTAHFRPERFAEETNACLSCANCEEKLCHHKRRLRTFWQKDRSRFFPSIKGDRK